eukprot:scaffold1462_cov64-Cyclotella_meneghiniana.AAC.5
MKDHQVSQKQIQAIATQGSPRNPADVSFFHSLAVRSEGISLGAGQVPNPDLLQPMSSIFVMRC